MIRVLAFCLVALVDLQSVTGYSSGAPSPTCGASGSMTPGHGSPAQTSPASYTLNAANGQTTYKTGETITLSLNGGGTQFTGFLIQAVSSAGTVAGTMVAPNGDSRVLICDGSASSGITHTNKTLKTSFTFQWRGPDAATNGDVTFYVTVVQDFSTYWVKVAMLTLNAESAGTAAPTGSGQTTGAPATVTPLPQTTVVSLSTGSILTSKPSQVTSNNHFVFANPDVTRTDSFLPVTSAHQNDNIAPNIDVNVNKQDLNFSENIPVTASTNALVKSTIGTIVGDKNANTAYGGINASSYHDIKGLNMDEKQRMTNAWNIITNTYPVTESYRYNKKLHFDDSHKTTFDLTRKKDLFSETSSVEYHKITYSTGRYETQNYRTKGIEHDILPERVDPLYFQNSSENVNDSLLDNTNMTVDGELYPHKSFDNSYFDSQNFSKEGVKFNNSISNLVVSNLTNNTLDAYPNLTRQNVLGKFAGNASSDIPETLKSTNSGSLTITELPLSDPDLIFNAAKRILAKNDNYFTQAEESFKTSEEKNVFKDTVVKESPQNITENLSGSHGQDMIRENLDRAQLVNDTERNTNMTFESDVTSLEMTNARTVDNSPAEFTRSRILIKQSSSNIPQTSLPQWDFSTTQPTVQSSVSTLREIVSEWTREHVHDIPDPIASTTSKGQGDKKSSEVPKSDVNSTSLIKLLDSDIPTAKVTKRRQIGGSRHNA